MPSRYREGLPKAVLEAMIQGVPVVVSRIGGMPELIRDGIDGIVVDPRCEDCLADALALLHSDKLLRERYSEAGRERINQAFNFQDTVRQTHLLYQAVLSTGNGFVEDAPHITLAETMASLEVGLPRDGVRREVNESSMPL